MRLVLPYQARRIRSIERHQHNWVLRKERFVLDRLWEERGETLALCARIEAARMRRGSLRLLADIERVPHGF